MSVLITGNTYPVKDNLKAMGGKWDATRKGWLVPEDKAAEARKLVGGTTPTTSRPSRPMGWRPCGYPGCNPGYCDECDGKGAGRHGRY